MRTNGRRLTWRKIQNGPAYEGCLLSYNMAHSSGIYRAIKLLGPMPKDAVQLPELYEPVLLGFAPLAFQLRGLERHAGPDGPYAVVQEWHCELP